MEFVTVLCDRKDILRLVKSYYPYYSHFDHPSIKKRGSFMGGFHDKWVWDDNELDNLTMNELLEIYNLCKQSWNEAEKN